MTLQNYPWFEIFTRRQGLEWVWHRRRVGQWGVCFIFPFVRQSCLASVFFSYSESGAMLFSVLILFLGVTVVSWYVYCGIEICLACFVWNGISSFLLYDVFLSRPCIIIPVLIWNTTCKRSWSIWVIAVCWRQEQGGSWRSRWGAYCCRLAGSIWLLDRSYGRQCGLSCDLCQTKVKSRDSCLWAQDYRHGCIVTRYY